MLKIDCLYGNAAMDTGQQGFITAVVSECNSR